MNNSLRETREVIFLTLVFSSNMSKDKNTSGEVLGEVDMKLLMEVMMG